MPWLFPRSAPGRGLPSILVKSTKHSPLLGISGIKPIAAQELRRAGQSPRDDGLHRKLDDTVISATASSLYKGTSGFASLKTILWLFSSGDGQVPS